MIVLEFLSVIIFTVSLLLYINNIIVDIGAAITAARTLNSANLSKHAEMFARFRMILSVLMGVSLAILICF